MAYEILHEGQFFGSGVEVSEPISETEFETLHDDNGDILIFKSVEEAKEHLRKSYEDKYINTLRFRYATVCLNCGTMMLVDADDVSKDELGICYTCPKCGGSFDVI